MYAQLQVDTQVFSFSSNKWIMKDEDFCIIAIVIV